jgi:hypothetical protein
VISDITGDSQKLAEQTIGVGYGDLMLASIACGLVEAKSGWSSGVGTVEPNPENREVCDELFPFTRTSTGYPPHGSHPRRYASGRRILKERRLSERC